MTSEEVSKGREVDEEVEWEQKANQPGEKLLLQIENQSKI